MRIIIFFYLEKIKAILKFYRNIGVCYIFIIETCLLKVINLLFIFFSPTNKIVVQKNFKKHFQFKYFSRIFVY